MRRMVRFERRITREEADTSRILVRRALVPYLQQIGPVLSVVLDGRRCEATLLSELCSCGGPSRPHCHHFLLLRGAVELAEASRVVIEVEAAAR